jgi:hypothetical protein
LKLLGQRSHLNLRCFLAQALSFGTSSPHLLGESSSTSGVLSGDAELVQFCITSSDVLITGSAKEKTYVAGVVVNESVNLFSLFRLFLFLRVWREELSSRFYCLHPCNPQRLVFVLCILCLSRDCSFQFGGSIKHRSQNVEEWKN